MSGTEGLTLTIVCLIFLILHKKIKTSHDNILQLLKATIQVAADQETYIMCLKMQIENLQEQLDIKTKENTDG